MRRPTAMQQRFIDAMKAGMDGPQAYVAAGYKTDDKDSKYIATEAGRLLAKPHIGSVIDEFRNEVDSAIIEKKVENVIDLGTQRNQTVWEKLLQTANLAIEAGKFADAVQALTQMGKMGNCADFQQPKEIEQAAAGGDTFINVSNSPLEGIRAKLGQQQPLQLEQIPAEPGPAAELNGAAAH